MQDWLKANVATSYLIAETLHVFILILKHFANKSTGKFKYFFKM